MRSLILLVMVVFIQATTARQSSAQLGRLFGKATDVETISTEQLKALVETNKSTGKIDVPRDELSETNEFVLIDVRSDAEMNVSIIPGAITKAQYEKAPQRYKDKTAIVYCTVGGRSATYAKQLAEQGIRVKNYKGSILEWVNAELPLQTLDGKPTQRVHTYSNRYRIPAAYEQVAQ